MRSHSIRTYDRGRLLAAAVRLALALAVVGAALGGLFGLLGVGLYDLLNGRALIAWPLVVRVAAAGAVAGFLTGLFGKLAEGADGPAPRRPVELPDAIAERLGRRPARRTSFRHTDPLAN